MIILKVTRCVEFIKWQSVSEWPRSGIELPGQLKNEEEVGDQLQKVTLVSTVASNLQLLQKGHLHGLQGTMSWPDKFYQTRSPTLYLFKSFWMTILIICNLQSVHTLVITDEKKIFNIRADKEGLTFNGDITFGSSLTF